MGVKSQMKYNNHNFSIYGNIEYVFSKFNNNIQKIQPNIIYPKFNFKLNSEYKFDFGLNARLNFVYMTGVNSYNSQSKEIETTKDVFLTNLYFEQLFDKNRIYIIINNLTNEIYL
jgi:long-subunit fatty acid transport protein